MKPIDIRTISTHAPAQAHLFSAVLKGDAGDDIVGLLHVDGSVREAEKLAHEWENTMKQSLITPASDDQTAYDRMEGVLKEMNGLLKGMMMGEGIHNVSSTIAVCESNGTLHISTAGQGEAYLIRGGSTVQITEHAGSGRELPHFLHISSGELESADAVLLTTSRLLRTVTPAQIAQCARETDTFLPTVVSKLEAEKEVASLASLMFSQKSAAMAERTLPSSYEEPELAPAPRTASVSETRGRRTRNTKSSPGFLHAIRSRFENVSGNAGPWLRNVDRVLRKSTGGLHTFFTQFLADLHNPARKRRAHLILLAGALVVFLAIWMAFQLTTNSKKTQDRVELEQLVEKINQDLRTAENRHMMGDTESANSILTRAEQEARNVMQNESGLFRTDALDLLDRIREKRESINNIIRLSPTVSANLMAKNPDITARGLIGVERGRMMVYDRQNLYSIIVNAVDDPQRLDGENLILDGDYFERYQTSVFMTKENRLIELIEGIPTAMKTDDPAGWISGPDMETYNRFLYILSPQNNQIYKYERLSNRYSTYTEYRVSDVALDDAIDMAIDADLYVLHTGGKITKLLRGEQSAFSFRGMPDDVMTSVTRIEKPTDQSNFYFLDPANRRVVITRADDDLGESLYQKQYILEGENVGELQDLWVDPEESQLYVLDEKRVYAINLQEG